MAGTFDMRSTKTGSDAGGIYSDFINAEGLQYIAWHLAALQFVISMRNSQLVSHMRCLVRIHHTWTCIVHFDIINK